MVMISCHAPRGTTFFHHTPRGREVRHDRSSYTLVQTIRDRAATEERLCKNRPPRGSHCSARRQTRPGASSPGRPTGRRRGLRGLCPPRRRSCAREVRQRPPPHDIPAPARQGAAQGRGGEVPGGDLLALGAERPTGASFVVSAVLIGFLLRCGSSLRGTRRRVRGAMGSNRALLEPWWRRCPD